MSASSPKGEFHAVMRTMGDGLFRAEYGGVVNSERPPVGQSMPDMHTGTSEQTVRAWVEALARSQGYDHVIWD